MRNYFLFLQVTWQIPSKLSKNKKYLFLNGERYEQPRLHSRSHVSLYYVKENKVGEEGGRTLKENMAFLPSQFIF